MEIRGKAWRPGDLKQFYNSEYVVCPEAYNDQAKAIEAKTDRVVAELMAHSGAKNDSVDICYNMDSREYKSLINDVREKALKEGREEAWDLARRIAAMGKDTYTVSELNSVFGSCGHNSIFEMPVDEALEKDTTYQKKKEGLHVGDEVEFMSDASTVKGYIVNINLSSTVRVLTKKYGTYTVQTVKCKKTGHHSDEIEKAMASFEEGEKR